MTVYVIQGEYRGMNDPPMLLTVTRTLAEARELIKRASEVFSAWGFDLFTISSADLSRPELSPELLEEWTRQR